MNKYLLFLYLFILSSLGFAGQSVELSTQSIGGGPPAQPVGNAWRVEFSISGWDSTFASSFPVHINDAGAVGVQVVLYGGANMFLDVHGEALTGGTCYGADLQIAGLQNYNFLTVRYQQDPVSSNQYLQAWDINGNMIANRSCSYSGPTGTNPGGADLNGGLAGENISTAYYRVYNATVPTNAQPPITAAPETNALVDWKFDGNLNDSSGNGYTAVLSSGSATYISTPGQSLIVPILQSSSPPMWGNYASARAGYPQQMSGLTSYSQSDAPTLTCFWQALPPYPSLPNWDNRASCTPTMSGLVFGDYPVQLVVTDTSTGGQATATAHIGAVAQDSNGVVVNADPNVDFLFGPMIAWGKNPWGYQDYWQKHASDLRAADYQSDGWIQGPLNKPQWEYTGQGTVSYYWNCVGPLYYCVQSLGTTLSASVATTDTVIHAASAAGLDLTELPTRIYIYDGTKVEDIRICSAAGNVLTVCYDGRPYPQSFASGVGVFQSKVTGTGTKFLTDANAPVCPLGIGPPGPASYSAGTIALTAGSATMTGTGTNWGTTTGVNVNDFVRVSATHSGTSFVFIAQVATIDSTTGITLTRVFPSDADTASGLSYDIMPGSRTLVVRYPHQTDPSGNGELMFPTAGCESEDAVYSSPLNIGNSLSLAHDLPGLDGTHETGELYSVSDTSGWVNQGSTGGIDFYGEGLAHRSLYYRSGLASAQTAANWIDDYWIKSPWGNADGNGNPNLFLGGAAVGAFADAILSNRVSWSDLREYGNLGLIAVTGQKNNGCSSWEQDDTRDVGWAYSWLILAAIFDPDTTSTSAPGGIPWRTYWQNQLAQMQTNDNNCKNADNSYSTGFQFSGGGVPNAITLTNGSTAATGNGFYSGFCNGSATGTATVTNGSAAVAIVTGTVPAGTTTLTVTGTQNSGASVLVGSYSVFGSASPYALGVLWPGDSGTVSWMSSSQSTGYASQAQTSFGTGHDDPLIKENWSCIYNSATSVTLNRPWDGPTASNYLGYTTNLSGHGQQPFMLGIKGIGMQWLASQMLPALSSYATAYQTLTKGAVQWIHDAGIDPVTLGTFYGRVYGFCEPLAAINTAVISEFRQASCAVGNALDAVLPSRSQNSEVGTAVSLFYDYNPSPANKTWADMNYGALWGYCAWTAGVYCDSSSPAANPAQANFADGFIHDGKWFGFFAGAGMSHRYPADRLGGVQPAVNRTVSIAFTGSAASYKVIVTAPSGAQTTTICAGSPCAVTVDDRQGKHTYQLQYLSPGGAIEAQSDVGTLY